MDTQVQTSLKPKHLSFDEMWKLYKILKVNKKSLQKYLADELMAILDTISPEEYGQVLLMLYGDKINLLKVSPIDSLVYVLDGLKFIKFFEFCRIMEELNG